MEAPVLLKWSSLILISLFLFNPVLVLAQTTPTREQAGPALTHMSNTATAVQLIDDMIHAANSALGKAAAIGCQFDDTSPGTVTENNVSPVRCSTRREVYTQIRDAAGNERGANVNSSNELLTNSNTELPAAISVTATGMTVPASAPWILAALSCYNGSTMDLCAPNVAHDAVATSQNPNLMGGYASAVVPSDVSADGDAVRAWYLRNGAQVVATTDPCSFKTKNYFAISQTTGTQLFTGTASNRTYVCSIDIVTATAQNISLVSGTGTVCATSTGPMSGGTTAATGWNFAANGGIVKGNSTASIYKSDTDADNICLLQSGSGQISGSLTYVVAPN